MRPFIIWARPRVGSSTLGLALGALYEPLQREDESWITVAEINRLCASRRSIKHIYEVCPTNLALVSAANRNGYRHIHLVRCNEFARLVSRGIAANEFAWQPKTAAEKFAAFRNGVSKPQPLDVRDLVMVSRQGSKEWGAIRAQLPSVLTVRFEDITAKSRQKRHATLRQLLAYIDTPLDMFPSLDRAMMAGGQDTKSVWDYAPNLSELRFGLAAGGVW